MSKINPTQNLLTMMADTSALAKKSSIELAEMMNKAVRAALTSATNAAYKADELRAQYKHDSEALAIAIHDGCDKVTIYKHGKPKTVALDDFRKHVAELEKVTATAIALSDQYTKDFNEYMETQKEMFKSKGLPSHRAYKEMIIGVGETKNPNGDIIQLMRIVKRDRDLEPVETEEETDKSLFGRIAFSYSGAVGMSKEEKRGKYNDGAMLINGEASNIDRSEYTDWAAM